MMTERDAPLRLTMERHSAQRPSALPCTAALLLVVPIALAPFYPTMALVLAVVLVTALSLTMAWFRRKQRAAPKPTVLVLDDKGVRRERGENETTLVAWSEPFGVTLFLRPGRRPVVLALTTRSATRFISVEPSVSTDTLKALRATLGTAVHMMPADLPPFMGLESEHLRGADAVELARHMAKHAPKAGSRLFLNDHRDWPVVIDEGRLHLGEFTVDLTAPVETRRFVFADGDEERAAPYDATWLRQGDVEFVLVAPARVAKAGAEEAAPREPRVPVDRLFFQVIRDAVEAAPRLARPASLPPPKPRTEKRA